MPVPAHLWKGTGIGIADNGSVAVSFPAFVPMCLGISNKGYEDMKNKEKGIGDRCIRA